MREEREDLVLLAEEERSEGDAPTAVEKVGGAELLTKEGEEKDELGPLAADNEREGLVPFSGKERERTVPNAAEGREEPEPLVAEEERGGLTPVVVGEGRDGFAPRATEGEREELEGDSSADRIFRGSACTR